MLMLILTACQDPSPFKDEGKDILEAYGEIRSDTLYALSDTFLVSGKVNTGNSVKLLLGSYQNFEARFLIKFGFLPPDSVIMDELYLTVSSAADFGDMTGLLEGMVYRVTDSWVESVNSDPNWDYKSHIDYSPETSAAFSIGDPDTTLYTDYSIKLPVKLVEIWQDTTGDDQNHGILVDFTSAGFIREFSSREGFFSTRVPRMVFVYHEAGKDSTISDTLVSTLDASLIDYTGIFDEDKIYVSSGYTTRAFFEFDFDSIPKNANISSINFFYDKDSLNSMTNDNRSHDIYIRNVTTDFNTLPGYEIDSTFLYSVRHNIFLSEEYSSGLSLDDDLRANAGQYFVQDIINEFVQHGSFFLQYINEGTDISVYAIKGVDYPDKAMRPRLIIEYFLNPDGRL
jgi:hypothetical protein